MPIGQLATFQVLKGTLSYRVQRKKEKKAYPISQLFFSGRYNKA